MMIGHEPADRDPVVDELEEMRNAGLIGYGRDDQGKPIMRKGQHVYRITDKGRRYAAGEEVRPSPAY
jgi:DNA-binding PadR family transcriptional regulator